MNSSRKKTEFWKGYDTDGTASFYAYINRKRTCTQTQCRNKEQNTIGKHYSLDDYSGIGRYKTAKTTWLTNSGWQP